MLHAESEKSCYYFTGFLHVTKNENPTMKSVSFLRSGGAFPCAWMLLAGLLASVPIAAAEEAVCVDAGRAAGVRVEGAAWKIRGGELVCEGTDNYLYAAKDVGAGDFRVTATLAIDKIGGSAASFVLGGKSHFGFSGRNGELFVEGPLFGGAARKVGDAGAFIETGKPFTFEAARAGGTLTISLDGKVVHRAKIGAGAVGAVGFRPWRARMRIRRFVVAGRLVVPDTGLDASKQVNVFTRGADGYHTYRIPSVIVTKAGTLLAFCEARKNGRGDAGNIDLVVKRSRDGGRTWGRMQVLWDDAGNTCGNPCPVVDRSTGRIVLLMTWNRGDDHESRIIARTSKDFRRPYVCASDDDGITWSKPMDLSKTCRDADWGWYATGPGVAIQLTRGPHKGRLVCPANHSSLKYRDHKYASHVIFSDDGGKSWRRSEPIRPGCNESQVVELADGALMMNMRAYAPRGRRMVAISKDGGATWTQAVPRNDLPEPTCQASFLRYTTEADGGRNRLLFSNPPTRRGRERMTVKLSYDEGKSWPVSRLVHLGGGAYSCLTVLPDRTIGLLYEKNGYKTITFARFPLDWLTRSTDKLTP